MALHPAGSVDPAPPVVVSVVDDHPMYRKAMCDLVERSTGLVLGVVAGEFAELEARLARPSGVVLLDLSMPGVSGVEAVERLVGAGHRVLVLTASERSHHLLATLDAGALGYVSKIADSDEIVAAIRQVARDERYVAPELAAKLLRERGGARASSAMQDLTDREREVLTLVADGHTDQEIGKQLVISIRTVRSHLDHIRTKTGARRRADLTRLALSEGLIDNDVEH
ncbi:MAG: response regulator [Phycicoccus sp.]